MPSIPYGKQHINQDDVDAVVESLHADFLTQGPRIKAFENEFAEYVGSKYGVAVANGTAALHLCALALDVNSQSKVITTPITFSASANCIRYCGGEVHFADIDPQTILLDIEKVRNMLEQAPPGTYQGIVPVDFAGYPVDLESFRELADTHDLWMIEDACHAPGGYFKDTQGKEQRCGNGRFADLSIFSFHPVKHIAAGEGGMITTNDPSLYKKLMMLRTHGITKDPSVMSENHGGWYYEMQSLGYNYRLTDIQSALASSQLRRAEAGLARRREIAQRYNLAFADSPIDLIIPSSNVGHAYHLYVIQVDNRKQVYDQLRSAGIYSQVHYIPVHTLPYYKGLCDSYGDLSQAEHYYSRCLSLPMYPTLTDDEQGYVISEVLRAVAQ